MISRHGKNSKGRAGRKPVASRMLALMLLLPFLAFALIPAKTMLAADAQGRMMVVLCGQDMPVEMAVAADGTLTPVSELGHHGADDGHQPCGWSSHGQPLLGGAGAGIVPPALIALAMDLGPARGGALHDLFAVAPAARGPPAVI